MTERGGTPESVGRAKSPERLQKQVEGTGLAFEPGDLQLSEVALKHKYGATYDRYVERLRAQKKNELLSAAKIYDSAYGGKKEQVPTWLTAREERRALVELAVDRLKPPVRALDIGCGTGATTSWIGEKAGNYWVGIDTVDQEKLGVKLPPNGEFLKGNFLDDAFIEKHKGLQQPFDMIIDHGAIATQLQEQDKLAEYISRIGEHVRREGLFVVLTSANPEGPSYNDALPDGRQRRFFSVADFGGAPFSEHFSVEDTRLITYAPDSPSNPYSKVAGNTREISVVQATLKKL
jgi:SAM-dependent methyltransferase